MADKMADIQASADVHQVELAQPPQGMEFVVIDEATNKRLVRKLDRNVIPLITALCT
jgi:hypothetical protein